MERRSLRGTRGAVRRPGAREDLRALLRHRWVWAILTLSALFPVAAVVNAPAEAVQPIVLAPARAVVPGNVAEPWRVRANEREAKRVAAKYLGQGYKISPQLAVDIHEAALEHGIEPEIAFGLVRAESSFRNSATSHVGAIGMTQLMPRTAAWMEPGTTRRDLRDPKTNLRIGFKYLRYLIDRYDGDTALALLAYNRGPGTVDRVLRRGGDPDNGYVDKVLGE